MIISPRAFYAGHTGTVLRDKTKLHVRTEVPSKRLRIFAPEPQGRACRQGTSFRKMHRKILPSAALLTCSSHSKFGMPLLFIVN
jgi:hypothetical protein